MDRSRREVLQDLLEQLPGIAKVYFQPPGGLTMEYPCIVYARDDAPTQFAANAPYRVDQQYRLTVIDRNPDNSVLKRLAFFPGCRYDRYFVVNNLHHDVFTIVF